MWISMFLFTERERIAIASPVTFRRSTGRNVGVSRRE